jgi:two-component sensor histidine kinase
MPVDPGRVRAADQHFIEAESRSGRPYLYAVVRLYEGEVVGLLARPAIRVDAPILTDLAIDVAIPVVLTALTLLIVWLATERVSLRWVRLLRNVALAHGQGAAGAGRDVADAPLEYRELSEALNSMTDAIEQRQSRLLSALAGRELLLREIHHRVKNNLQIIISLFNLQARNTEDEDQRLLIRDMLARVESMALVHHAAYQSDDVQLISMKSFVPNLITHLSHTLDDRSTDIHVETEVDDIFLTMDETIPLAQLMTEAISNSIKHAFVGRPEGRIVFRLLRTADRRITLEIADDGIGLPADFEQRPVRRQLGQSLMSAFARQLGGTISVHSGHGTTIRAELSLQGGERAPFGPAPPQS